MPTKSIVVPDIGDFKDVDVIDVLVKPGDTIAVDTPLLTLETEKATMDVPSAVAGRIVSVAVKKGDKVSSGSAVAEVEIAADAPAPSEPAPPATAAPAPATAAEPAPAPAPVGAPAPAATRGAPSEEAAPARAAAAAPARTPPPVAGPSQPAPGLAPVEEAGFARAYAGPSVRRLARELGVDLAKVSGSGAKARITHEDVKAFVKASLATLARGDSGPPLPRVATVDFARFGRTEVEPLNRIQRIAGPRLHASWVTVPHVTQFDLADITELEAVRGQLKQKAAVEGLKLTPLAFVLRALARTLGEFPRFCASLDATGESLVLKKYMHIGFAADTPNGLVVPVIRDADRKDVYELARELAALSEKARTGKLAAAEMQGGCFTVSSLGGIGGTAFTPIINAPELAILGVSRSAWQPLWQDGKFVPRLMLPLSLSYDHRVIDGAAGARFTTALCAALADVRGLLEAVP
jgi:pyruvate dehydrogenase E2 component (dihydrolipoyllysine-residue acetyltransferase)